MPASDAPARAASIEARAIWDYRKYTVTSSDATQTELPPLPIPRDPQRVTIQLPRGFMPCAYEVDLPDTDLRSGASAKSVAEMGYYVATVETSDVNRLPAGAYQVAVRREGESWRMFPAILQ